MTTRLIALIMLPVTVMCVLAGSVIVSHHAVATQAVTVEHGVSTLSDLVALERGLHVQESAEALEARFAEYGVTREVALAFIGFDWAAEAPAARARADRALTVLGDTSPVSAADLQSLYAEIDGATIAPAAARQRLADFADSIEGAVTVRVDRLQADTRQPQLVAALESLRAANVLIDAASPQLIDLSAIWFPANDRPQATSAAMARFGATSTEYGEAVALLHKLDVKSVVADLGRIEAEPEVRAFDAAVAATLAGEPLTAPGTPVDLVKVAGTFRAYFVRGALLDGLITTATTTARDEARHVAAAERAGLVEWSLGAAALALASIGFALRLGRSISRPLKDLADYAHAVNEGRLDVEPSARRYRGPRETRLAFSVFTDLVANLQLLDAKANALAHCDFDDPVLREPLPGRLGRSLESSVALLSGSIVERDQLQTYLAHQATHDSLTGIGNRPAAISGIHAAMNRAARSGTATALLFVDLNEFKAVNDSHGHEVGDEVLRQVASRLTIGLRSGDFAARLGGDEFVVVVESVAGIADATDLARRLIHDISQPIEVGELRITIGAAVGIAMSVDGPEDPLRLLARADAAMYRAKHHERSAIEIFDADLQEQMITREDIETALAAALAAPGGGGLQLHYQPVLDATSGEMVGAEALIRWDRPGHGLLTPDSFIPIAEATALIIELDCWVLAEATRQMVAWAPVAELADIRVSVNISGRHLLSRQLPDHVRTVLDETGVDPHRLSIEITETVLLTDLITAATELNAVRSLGVNVAIDDFGTGYTSLAHLERLPIDTIKIDRSFIANLNLRRGSSLVRMVTDLGHAIDISIVAEGVETSEEMSALQAMGADHLQGYLLSRPLPAAALSAWAAERVAARSGAPVSAA